MKTGFTKEQVQEAIESSHSAAEICRKLDCVGYTLDRLCKQFNLHYEVNRGGKGLIKKRKYKTADDVFKEGVVSSGSLIYYLKQEREWKCECCGLTEWQGKPLSLEIHHIDGNHKNNVRENLQILCPNCHAQTETWRSRNIKGTNKHAPRVSDQDLLEALRTTSSINQALQKVGLAGGANYYRAYRLLNKAPVS